MPPLTPHVSDDVFLHIPPVRSTPSPSTLIFFVSGNPGLISYYHSFLNILSRSQHGEGCVVAGYSLGGFEVEVSSGYVGPQADGKEGRGRGDGDGDGGVRGLQWPANATKRDGELYGLLEQVELCYARIELLVRKLRDQRQNKGDGEEGEAEGAQGIRTVLIGHSVGAYISLEVIRLWSERRNRPTAASEGREENDQLLWHPSAAILLMPTIIDLHKSPSGQLATPVLSTVPFLPQVVQLAATAIKYGLPGPWLSRLISRVTGMQPGHGLESTVNFLLSEKGVKQALHLARDELVMIRADGWGEEVWGAGDGKADGGNGLKTYFLFAKEDHWVADATRDEILKVRGGRGKFVVDQEGLVHAWPLKQSEVVAQTVVDWLREILGD